MKHLKHKQYQHKRNHENNENIYKCEVCWVPISMKAYLKKINVLIHRQIKLVLNTAKLNTFYELPSVFFIKK